MVQPYPASLRTHLDFLIAAFGTFNPRPRLLQLLRHGSIVESVDEGWELGSSLIEYSYRVRIECAFLAKAEAKTPTIVVVWRSWVSPSTAFLYATTPPDCSVLRDLACRLCPRLLRNVFASGLLHV